MTQPLKPDGKVLRLSTSGIPKLVASGFINPMHLRFIDHKLWVSDLNGDFIGGKRKLRDGFIVEIIGCAGVVSVRAGTSHCPSPGWI